MKQIGFFITVVLLALLVSACNPPEQGQVGEAQDVVGVPDKSNFTERVQVAAAELLNDQRNRVFWWYIFGFDGALKATFTCIGRPVSSTESLEPNLIYSWYSGEYNGFKVPLQGGITAYSPEAMGIDGTYGDPVPFRYCITPEGHYVDVSFMSPYIVTTAPMTFEPPLARFDEELEAKKLLAEQALREGKCIDSNLNVIDCSQVYENLGEEIEKTHYLEEAEEADRVAIIDKGKIVSLGTPEQIKKKLIKSYLLIGSREKGKLETQKALG